MATPPSRDMAKQSRPRSTVTRHRTPFAEHPCVTPPFLVLSGVASATLSLGAPASQRNLLPATTGLASPAFDRGIKEPGKSLGTCVLISPCRCLLTGTFTRKPPLAGRPTYAPSRRRAQLQSRRARAGLRAHPPSSRPPPPRPNLAATACSKAPPLGRLRAASSAEGREQASFSTGYLARDECT